MQVRPGLKQFRQEGCLSYIFFDAQAGTAVMIDPRADLMDEYREYLSEWKLKPFAVVDTRLHWHHLSGSHLFAESYGIPIAMSANTKSERVTRRLVAGDGVEAGRFRLEVLDAPGVAVDAICLAGHGLLFTGDTIEIGASARTDMPGADPVALWNSLHRLAQSLPESTVVLPGFDRPGLLFSTLGIERQRNPDLRAASADELARAKSGEEAPRGEGDVKRRFDFNLRAAPVANAESHWGSGLPPSPSLRGNQGIAAISVEKYAQKIKGRSTGTLFVDVRERAEYAAGHMPGAVNFPLSELSLHLDELRSAKRIYISCRIGRRSRLATRTLDYLGFSDVVDVSGGFQAWQNGGLPIVT